MNASKLAEILLKNPDAEIYIEQYNGGCDSAEKIIRTKFFKAGKLIGTNGHYVKTNAVMLYTYEKYNET